MSYGRNLWRGRPSWAPDRSWRCTRRTLRKTAVVRGEHSIGLLGALALVACAETPPSGPSVVGVPPQTKDLAQFQREDSVCRQYASQQIGSGTAAQVTSQIF